jgi:hypothetical protein
MWTFIDRAMKPVATYLQGTHGPQGARFTGWTTQTLCTESGGLRRMRSYMLQGRPARGRNRTAQGPRPPSQLHS